jgi:hypothetical protein
MAMSDAERAANYRWAQRMEKALGKVQTLIAATPKKYKDNPGLSPVETEWELWNCLEELLETDIEFQKEGEAEYVRFKIPNFGRNFGRYTRGQLSAIADYDTYIEAKHFNLAQRASPAQVKTSRNEFCKNVLGAELTNLRWGWVGIKEVKKGNTGELFIFAWEHNKGSDGEGTVRLFHKDASVDANGRKRPGHRDALQKIERAVQGEFIPFVVWQVAQEINETPKKIEFINSSFVSRVELYVDEEGFWTGKICEDIPIGETEK